MISLSSLATVWGVGAVALTLVVVPYELFFGSKNHREAFARMLLCGIWPLTALLVLCDFVARKMRARGAG